MHKSHIILGIILVAINWGCKEEKVPSPADQYILNGELEDIEAGTWVKLMLDDKAIDSTQVEAKKFTMMGQIDHPKEVALVIKETKNYSRFWLEPGTITYKAKKGDFKNAKIVGSKSQEEDELIFSMLEEFRSRRDSLSTIYRHPKTTDSIKKIVNEELEIMYEKHTEIEQQFIKDHPNSYISAYFLDFYTTTMGKTKSQELFDVLTDSVKNSSYGKSISRYLSLNKDPKVGDKYVDFSMPNKDGEIVSLSDYEGKLVLLDFWASWCGPCIKEYPALRKAYNRFSDEDFEIVSISEDRSKEAWLDAIDKNNLNWVNLWQENGRKSDPYLIYGINGIPDNFLIDQDGTIIARNLRGEKLIDEIENVFEDLVQENRVN